MSDNTETPKLDLPGQSTQAIEALVERLAGKVAMTVLSSPQLIDAIATEVVRKLATGEISGLQGAEMEPHWEVEIKDAPTNDMSFRVYIESGEHPTNPWGITIIPNNPAEEDQVREDIVEAIQAKVLAQKDEGLVGGKVYWVDLTYVQPQGSAHHFNTDRQEEPATHE